MCVLIVIQPKRSSVWCATYGKVSSFETSFFNFIYYDSLLRSIPNYFTESEFLAIVVVSLLCVFVWVHFDHCRNIIENSRDKNSFWNWFIDFLVMSNDYLHCALAKFNVNMGWCWQTDAFIVNSLISLMIARNEKNKPSGKINNEIVCHIRSTRTSLAQSLSHKQHDSIVDVEIYFQI